MSVVVVSRTEFSKEELESWFRSGIWDISFKKKDGDIRNMICTRNLVLIPVEHHPEDSDDDVEEEKKPNPNVVVFDLEKKAWRSFVPSSLIDAREYLVW